MSERVKRNGEDSSSEAEDGSIVAEELAYREARKNLIRGERVLLEPKFEPHSKAIHIDKKELAEPWYIDHI